MNAKDRVLQRCAVVAIHVRQNAKFPWTTPFVSGTDSPIFVRKNINRNGSLTPFCVFDDTDSLPLYVYFRLASDAKNSKVVWVFVRVIIHDADFTTVVLECRGLKYHVKTVKRARADRTH